MILILFLDLIHFTDPSAERQRSTTSESVQMDPTLIERIIADGGDIYTVVSKVNDSDFASKKDDILSSTVSDLSSSFGSPKYSHLIHNKEHQRKKPTRPPPPVRYSVISSGKTDGQRILPSSQSATGNNAARYEEVSENKLVLTPASPPCSSQDNDMWVSVKWQSKSHEAMTSSQRSSSQTALDNLLAHEEYTNLDEIAKGKSFIAQQRRRSFSEGETTIPVSMSRGSIIPILSPQNAAFGHSDEADIYSTPTDDLDSSQTYTVPPDALYGNVPMQADDYVNYNADEYSHDYLNEEELREQLRNNPILPLSEEIVPATVIQQKVPALGLKDMLMQNLRIKKPSTKTVIQSSAVTANTQQESIPMFHFSEKSGRGLQVGRGDYMEFSIDSWGSKMQEESDQEKQSFKKHSNKQSSPLGVSSACAWNKSQESKEGGSVTGENKVSRREPPPKPPLPPFLQQGKYCLKYLGFML